jgi:hypothetical protein
MNFEAALENLLLFRHLTRLDMERTATVLTVGNTWYSTPVERGTGACL